MSRTSTRALAVSKGLLRALIVLNMVAGLFILGLLVFSFVNAPFLVDALDIARDGADMPMAAMRLMMLIGLASLPLAHILFSRLLGIVKTVEDGNPFVMPNAHRLRACAWAMLGLEAMHLAVGVVAMALPIRFDWEFRLTGLLAVLLLFVLAEVFAEGARMRDDLEGTV